MAINNDLIVTGLDFDTIRANLRAYISSKPEFTDYDFSDSALGSLLDLLAYNTYYNSFYVNMAMNESFLDSAQLYDSVVSHAKTLGYTPTSARGATANVRLIFTNSVANGTFRSITVPKNTKFTTVVNGSSYTFVTPQTYTITANTTNGFADYINIVEGIPLTHRYVYNRTSNTSFVLPNKMIDTTSIAVSVTTGGNTQSYFLGNDILSVNSTSQAFFVEADRQQKYKVSFGDGVIGKQPATDSIVSIYYRVCNGGYVNGSNTFTLTNTTIDGQSSIFIEPVGRASGGADIEDIESVRFNAPRLYETQNRSVTTNDYERIILRDNPDIQAVSVWGGEQNNPPIYGKVFVCAKPKNSTRFSLYRKNQIENEIRKYNVQSIDTVIVDPTYLYVIPEVSVRYDPSQTSLTPGELAAAVGNRIVQFETQFLSSFDKSFRYSKFLNWIDQTDDSIKTTNANIRLKKTFVPNMNSIETYTVNFNNQIQKLGSSDIVPSSQTFGSLTSSPFVIGGNDSFFDDTGYGTIRTYYRSGLGTANRVYTSYNSGTVDYSTGIVTINSFLPDSALNDEISIIVSPISPSVVPIRNQILLISNVRVDIVDDIKNLVVATSSTVETTGQTATIQTPSIRLYNY